MTTFRRWYLLNQDKLQEDYEAYFESVDKEIDVPMEFDDFVQDKWDSFDGYVEREERE
jgi:hypothetical protein